MGENPTIPFFLGLAIIIFGARLFGSIARFINQPRVLGELIAGLVLGPTLLNMPDWIIFEHVLVQEMVKPFAELGVLFLMFLIGLEVELRELARVGWVAIIGGILGALVPVMLTIPIAMYFGYDVHIGLFAGVTLAATSVSISAQVLLEMGHLRSKEGIALIATTLIDDVLAMLLISMTMVIIGGSGSEGSSTSLLSTLVRMILFASIGLALSWFVLPRTMNWFNQQSSIAQSNGIPTLAIMFMLVFAWAAEALGGIAMITGAFIAGLGLSRLQENIKREIEENARAITYTFLMPIFFINVGLSTDLSAFPLSAVPMGIALLVAAIISKLGGVGLGARLAGFSNIEALRVGVCMISRGEVGLIIVSLGLSNSILKQDDPLFASLFLVIFITTILTPILVRQVFPDTTHQMPKEGYSA